MIVSAATGVLVLDAVADRLTAPVDVALKEAMGAGLAEALPLPLSTAD